MKRFLISHIVLSVFLLGTGLSSQAFAAPHHDGPPHASDWHSDRFDYGRRPYFHRHLPATYVALRIADALYYYADGLYYRETPSGYVIVTAPRGAIIRELPERHKVIVYDHTDYYYYDNVYYLKQPEGYQVVSPPAQVVSTNPVNSEAPEKSIVVQVPNPNGSFIPVTLQKYSDGYTGPNGEFYPSYPTIEQLKAMYSKSSATAEAPEKDEELVYDIPNANGSFTRVKVLKTKDGYVGPEGEFYPQKPTEKQLAAMYAKK